MTQYGYWKIEHYQGAICLSNGSDILVFMLFAGESCQSENKMTLFNFRLLFLDPVISLFKIDYPYIISKLKNSEPSSTGLQARPVGSVVHYKKFFNHAAPFS